jgi:hypothetical protein
MHSNAFNLLNADKTEFRWFATPRRQDQLPVDVIRIGGHDITPAASARNLGVYFNFDLSVGRHTDVITVRCYASLRQLRAIRRYTSQAVMQSLVTSLLQSPLDYCNSALFGIPASSIQCLQVVQNAVARLVINVRRSEQVTNALI